MNADDTVSALLGRARHLQAIGQDEAAKVVYLDLLRKDSTHFDALNELGTLALASGHRSAADTSYRQAVQCHPDNPMGRVNLGNLLFQGGDFAAARVEYEAALTADGEFAEAHQGLARILTELDETEAAKLHWEKGFSGRAIVAQRYRGISPSIRVLLLVAARDGNIPTSHILDDRVFEVTALYPEFHDPTQALPSHALVFNAIGDVDLCLPALLQAERVVAQTNAPVINPPARIRLTGRAANAERLRGLTSVVVPSIHTVRRSAIGQDDGLTFPLLLRAPGFHTGRHFVQVERRENLEKSIAGLPGEALLAIEYLDARGPDGMARKYRVMIVDGALYPLHLAISADWKVHYFTAGMATNAGHRTEERRFLEDMPAVLSAGAMSALAGIAERLGLDYAGIDFGLATDGSVLLFEANATMVVFPPDPDPMWDYRRAPISRVIDAVKQMLLRRAAVPAA